MNDDESGSDTTSLSWVAQKVREPSASGIAAAITELIRRGDLKHGAKLPTVRQLAGELGVSPGTVSAAWLHMRRRRIIATRRRGGTTVVGRPGAPHPHRFDSVGNFGDRLQLDLTFATPDPDLLPELEPALRHALGNEQLNTYTRDAITPRLAAALETRWPFPANGWHAVNGGYEGMMLLCQTSIGHGETVAVEDPTAPRLLDILGVAGTRNISIPCDEDGPLPDALARAAAAGAVAFVYQPRSNSPRGHSVSKSRSSELADALKNTSLLIIEDDGVADAASSNINSLGVHFPERTVLVRSFSKAYGPDLRIGVLGGAREPIRLARAYRNFGSRWTSRILQDALAYLLDDQECQQQIAAARHCYADRRDGLASTLHQRGVAVRDRDGLCLWVPVPDEKYALVTFAAHGMAVTPGSRFFVHGGPDHVRIATGQLKHGYDEVADCVALAAGRRPDDAE